MSFVRNARSAIRRRLPPTLRHAYYRRELKKRRRPGIPPTANRAIVEEIVVRELGANLQRAFHAEFSGYKHGTAWLVWLFGGRSRLTIAFKDVHLADYPAVEGFPGGRPGLPEAALYSTPTIVLKRSMPELYAITEVIPGERYQYYLADLGRQYRNIMTVSDQFTALDHLSRIGRALAEWAADRQQTALIDYSAEFPREFLRYAYATLSEYCERSGDRGAIDICRDWECVTDLYLGATPPSARDYVHGDYRDGNLFIHRRTQEDLRAVDWEFAGRGWIHNDVVSLFKRSDQPTVQAALGRLVEMQPAHSPTEHRRLLLRCRLERNLMDAALVAKQRMAKEIEPLRVSRYHFSSARQTMDSLVELARGGSP